MAVGAAHRRIPQWTSVTYLARALVVSSKLAIGAAGEGLAQGLLSTIPEAAPHILAGAIRYHASGGRLWCPSGGSFFGAGRLTRLVETSLTYLGAASRGPAILADGLRAAYVVETTTAAATETAGHVAVVAVRIAITCVAVTSSTCVGAASRGAANNNAEGLRAGNGLACAYGSFLAVRLAGFSIAAAIRITGRAVGLARACLDALGFPAAEVVDAADVFRQTLFCRS